MLSGRNLLALIEVLAASIIMVMGELFVESGGDTGINQLRQNLEETCRK
jgi:hypothetical protein